MGASNSFRRSQQEVKLITVNVSRYALVIDAIIGGEERGRAPPFPSPSPWITKGRWIESFCIAERARRGRALPSENYGRGGAEEGRRRKSLEFNLPENYWRNSEHGANHNAPWIRAPFPTFSPLPSSPPHCITPLPTQSIQLAEERSISLHHPNDSRGRRRRRRRRPRSPHVHTYPRIPVCVSRIHPGLSAVKLSDLPRIFHGTPFVSSRSSRGAEPA